MLHTEWCRVNRLLFRVKQQRDMRGGGEILAGQIFPIP